MLAAHLETRTIAFRRYTRADLDAVYAMTLRSGMEPLPSIEAVEGLLESPSRTIFLIDLQRSGVTVGYCSIKGPEPAGHAFVAIYADTAQLPYSVGAEAMTLVFNYAFAVWDEVRKVYFQTTDASIERFETALFKVPREATLRQHGYFQGKFWDNYVYSIYREPWEHHMAPFVEQLVSGDFLSRAKRTRKNQAQAHTSDVSP